LEGSISYKKGGKVEMLKVEVVRYDDLTDKEKDSSLSNNGSGKEFASYLRVSHPDRDAFLESDAM